MLVKRVERLRHRRDEVRQWLAGETETAIIHWIENYITDLDSQIRWGEMNEERRF